MRISYEWLKTLVDIPDDPNDLVREFIRTGTEVEAVDTTGADITHVVTSQVLSKTPHPDSDHMFVCKMDVGTYHTDDKGNPIPLQVVCGAQNFNEGDKTVTALVGATLPGDIHIKKGKLRGVESCGMNCSARELGLSSDHTGIMILDPTAPVGVDFCTWKNLRDTVIDCEITPNRPDCLSMLGIAHEVSAMYNEPCHISLEGVKHESARSTQDLVDVRIEDDQLCPRYTARVLHNVVIKESPEWLRKRLIAAGTRPINNVVDITNYVMYLTGQPLHAFDLAKLSADENGKRHIVVRAAHAGETLVTLDDQERTLTDDMIVISDNGQTPLALAGVMGGKNSEIDESTQDVLLESAAFSAGHISRTSRNLDLMSEASIRYERQIDVNGCARASEIAAALFEAYASAEVSKGLLDVYPHVVEPVCIKLRSKRVCDLAGETIDPSFMKERLERLGCTVKSCDPSDIQNADVCTQPSDNACEYLVYAPTNRPDLTREIDLVEEIVRLWGEGDITPTLPAARNHAGGLSEEQRYLRCIGATLRASGLSETTTYNFADPADLERLGMSCEGRGVPIQIIRPLVADQSEMRRDIIPGLLRSVAYNLDHGVKNVHLYEIGRVFFGHEHKSQPTEAVYVAGVMCGSWADDAWCASYPAFDFFDVKGVVEQLCERLRLTKVRYKVADPQAFGWLQPGCAAELICSGEHIGWLGVLHPKSCKNFGVSEPVMAFELSCAALLRHAHHELPYQDVPTLPGVSIDLALVVDEDLDAESIMQRLSSAGGKLLTDVRLFDVYRDEVRVGAHKKSMTFSLTYRCDDHTLTSEEVNKAHTKLIAKITRSCKAEIRS